MNETDHALLPVSIVLSSADAIMAVLMILTTCVWLKGTFILVYELLYIDELGVYLNTDKNEYSICNCVEKILCVMGCIGTVLLTLAWAFYAAKHCKYLY